MNNVGRPRCPCYLMDDEAATSVRCARFEGHADACMSERMLVQETKDTDITNTPTWLIVERKDGQQQYWINATERTLVPEAAKRFTTLREALEYKARCLTAEDHTVYAWFAQRVFDDAAEPEGVRAILNVLPDDFRNLAGTPEFRVASVCAALKNTQDIIAKLTANAKKTASELVALTKHSTIETLRLFLSGGVIATPRGHVEVRVLDQDVINNTRRYQWRYMSDLKQPNPWRDVGPAKDGEDLIAQIEQAEEKLDWCGEGCVCAAKPEEPQTSLDHVKKSVDDDAKRAPEWPPPTTEELQKALNLDAIEAKYKRASQVVETFKREAQTGTWIVRSTETGRYFTGDKNPQLQWRLDKKYAKRYTTQAEAVRVAIDLDFVCGGSHCTEYAPHAPWIIRSVEAGTYRTADPQHPWSRDPKQAKTYATEKEALAEEVWGSKVECLQLPHKTGALPGTIKEPDDAMLSSSGAASTVDTTEQNELCGKRFSYDRATGEYRYQCNRQRGHDGSCHRLRVTQANAPETTQNEPFAGSSDRKEVSMGDLTPNEEKNSTIALEHIDDVPRYLAHFTALMQRLGYRGKPDELAIEATLRAMLYVDASVDTTPQPADAALRIPQLPSPNDSYQEQLSAFLEIVNTRTDLLPEAVEKRYRRMLALKKDATTLPEPSWLCYCDQCFAVLCGENLAPVAQAAPTTLAQLLTCLACGSTFSYEIYSVESSEILRKNRRIIKLAQKSMKNMAAEFDALERGVTAGDLAKTIVNTTARYVGRDADAGE